VADPVVVPDPDGQVYQHRRADVLVAAAGLGVVIACGMLVANRLLAGPDVALFHRINHWPGWLYPPMWVVQLSEVIGALPLLAAAAALLRRFRLAAALVAATLLKVSLESVAKTLVHRGRPAETVSDVILCGNSAAHGLSFPSGHAMVIFAITALEYPYLKDWRKVLPWALAAAVCLSRAYLGAHFPLDVVAGGGSRHNDRGRAQPDLRRAQHQFQHSPRQRVPVTSTRSTPRGGRGYYPSTRFPSIPQSRPRLTRYH
jgi:membrane-associated phospholipid phosphatase